MDSFVVAPIKILTPERPTSPTALYPVGHPVRRCSPELPVLVLIGGPFDDLVYRNLVFFYAAIQWGERRSSFPLPNGCFYATEFGFEGGASPTATGSWSSPLTE